MRVEQACRLSVDGTAKTKVKIRTVEGSVLEISLYAKYNEIQERYTVTPYYNRQKLTTARQFVDPHKIDRWNPSRRFAVDGKRVRTIKTEYCLYMLVSKTNYQFVVGMTNNLYSRVYQLRLLFGEFDLDSSCVIYGGEKRLSELESTLRFIFEEYHFGKSTILEGGRKDWFDLDCFWYMKNEIRRLQSFREDKLFRLFEGIDLHEFLISDAQTDLENAELIDDE